MAAASGAATPAGCGLDSGPRPSEGCSAEAAGPLGLGDARARGGIRSQRAASPARIGAPQTADAAGRVGVGSQPPSTLPWTLRAAAHSTHSA